MVQSMSRPASFSFVVPALALALFASGASGAVIQGRVLNAQTSEPIPYARVRVLAPPVETSTGADGGFRLSNLVEGTYEVEATRVGYVAERRSVTVDMDTVTVEFRIQERPVPVAAVEVTTTRASERGSAVAFTDLDRKAVEERYWAQDVPMLLAETPGVYSYSDAGNGIGYSYVKVRGF